MNRWQTSNRASRLPGNWKTLRLQVLKRDNHQCTWVIRSHDGIARCAEEATEVDHIQRGDDHSMENLQSLCKAHHAYKTNREGIAQRRKNLEEVKSRLKREPEKHPALIAGSANGYNPLFQKWAQQD